jgi:hypothetical protein
MFGKFVAALFGMESTCAAGVSSSASNKPTKVSHLTLYFHRPF